MQNSMKKVVFGLLFLVCCGKGFCQQKAELISFSELENKINAANDQLFVINFWATWCGPCLAELPDFLSFFSKNKDENISLLLVSFDFPKEIEKVNKFIQKKKIRPAVYVISDSDQNMFINKVSKQWEGTIPATWFVNTKNNKEVFVEKPLNEQEINKYLTNIK
jgi:thiol-disulfide isomerase/thioredoxin